jgi:hypothetical protein
MLLGSMQASLRANAMAALTWAMVTEVQGQVAEVLPVLHSAYYYIYIHVYTCMTGCARSVAPHRP